MKKMSRISLSRANGVAIIAMLLMISLLLMDGIVLAYGQLHSSFLNV